MSDVAICVRGVSKRYQIGEKRGGYKTLRESLVSAVRAPFRRNGHAPAPAERAFWALKDVTFDVHRGEIVGVIGRNGAGKSTLLKILSRITDLTEGEIEISGRVGSLLEVGTGFHQELTGRENIFLNGAILGMKRAEIAARFDEIVAFAGTEKFLDTPVKYYSSGMYMRLAFAVAAHLEPEILVVDEVLAVGDAEFQKKCLGKMGDVARSGRTVLFVSHNLSAINTLCSRAFLLTRGVLIKDAPPSEVISEYHSRCFGNITASGDLTGKPRTGNGKATFTSIIVQPLSSSGEEELVLRPGSDLRITVEIESRLALTDISVDVTIYDPSGFRLIDVNTGKKAIFLQLQPGEKVSVQFVLRDLLLKPGSYPIELWTGRQLVEEMDLVSRAAMLDVAPDVRSSNSAVVWPGPYACCFECSVARSTKADDRERVQTR